MSDLVDEIKEMNELEGEHEEVNEPSTEPTEDPSPPVEEPSGEDSTPEEPAPEATIDPYENLIQRLAKVEKELEEANKKPEEPEPEPSIESQDFLSGFDDEDLGDIPREKLNKILNAVYETGVKTARSQATESIFRKLPDVIKNNVSTYVALTEATRQFYVDNPDLKAHAAKVAEVYESFAAENMDKPVHELFNELGDKVRSVLKLQKVAKAPAPTLPGGTKKKSGPKETPKLSGMMAEIAAMNALED